MPRSTLPLSERVQNMVLCAMDRASYKPSKLPRISDATTRTSPMTEDLNLAYLGIGTLVFDTLAHKVLHGLPGLELPASHDLACQTLKSPRTCARILLATTGYQDVAGCPFIGMDAPELADALLRFFGMFTAASGKKGLFRLRPWFEHAYKNLAVAAAKAMDPNALIRIPKYPTKYSDLRLPAPKVQKKVPKITTILTVEKKVLVDITNSEDGVRGAGRSSRKKKSSARPAPYPTPYVKTEPDALLASTPSRSTEPSSIPIAGTLVISAPTSHADPQSIKPSTTLATNLVPIFSVPPPPPSRSNYPQASFLRTLAPASLHATTHWQQRRAPRNKQASPPRAPPHAFPVVGFGKVWCPPLYRPESYQPGNAAPPPAANPGNKGTVLLSWSSPSPPSSPALWSQAPKSSLAGPSTSNPSVILFPRPASARSDLHFDYPISPLTSTSATPATSSGPPSRAVDQHSTPTELVLNRAGSVPGSSSRSHTAPARHGPGLRPALARVPTSVLDYYERISHADK